MIEIVNESLRATMMRTTYVKVESDIVLRRDYSQQVFQVESLTVIHEFNESANAWVVKEVTARGPKLNKEGPSKVMTGDRRWIFWNKLTVSDLPDGIRELVTDMPLPTVTP